MKKTLSNILLSGLLLGLASCTMISNVNSGSGSGSIKMSVKFPQGSFSIKAIPDNTNLIIVTVSGEGLTSTSPLVFNLTKEENSKIINNVPQGNKDVNVKALGVAGDLLAEGEGKVNIIASKLNRVEVELKVKDKPVTASPSPKPTPITIYIPSSSECNIRLNHEDLPLKESVEKALTDAGCKIIVIEPSPTPSPSIEPTPTPTATPFRSSGGGGSSNSDSGGDNNNSVPVNVNISDGEDGSDSPLTAQ